MLHDTALPYSLHTATLLTKQHGALSAPYGNTLHLLFRPPMYAPRHLLLPHAHTHVRVRARLRHMRIDVLYKARDLVRLIVDVYVEGVGLGSVAWRVEHKGSQLRGAQTVDACLDVEVVETAVRWTNKRHAVCTGSGQDSITPACTHSPPS